MCLWLFGSIFIFFEFLVSVTTRGIVVVVVVVVVVWNKNLLSSNARTSSVQAMCNTDRCGVTMRVDIRARRTDYFRFE